MTFLTDKKRKAFTTIEYMMLIIFILVSFFVFKLQLERAVSGRWKNVGDSFGVGRQFDPDNTIECAYDYEFHDTWYDVRCFESYYVDRNCPNTSSTPTTCCQYGNEGCKRTAISWCSGSAVRNICDDGTGFAPR